VPIWVSLGLIVLILGVTAVLSLRASPSGKPAEESELA
jgi:hypothetical protein